MTIDRTSGDLEISLTVESPERVVGHTVPLSVGLPLPRGEVRAPFTVESADGEPVQTTILDRWPDGSVRWALADFLLPGLPAGTSELVLVARETGGDHSPESSASAEESDSPEAIRLSGERFDVEITDRTNELLSLRSPTAAELLAITIGLHQEDRTTSELQIEDSRITALGPVRSEVTRAGRIGGGLRFRARTSFWPAASLLRIRLTLHNPHRAHHPGGLWDLGDAGSFGFEGLDLALRRPGGEPLEISCRAEPTKPWRAGAEQLHLYQDSSGGEFWNSPNHVNGRGEVPCRFRGYQLREDDRLETGLRASPVVGLRSGDLRWVSALPDFWQKFPKGLRTDDDAIVWELFPRSWNDTFELQGGERTTHDVWLQLEGDSAESIDSLEWVHRSPRAFPSPQAIRRAGVAPMLDLPAPKWDTRLEQLLEGKLEGDRSFFAIREAIDEYGWRHYGDLWADHEETYYQGPSPVISHYNNQYDVLYGFLLQLMRTGDSRWLELALPLARHVMDIDIYNTTEDRSAYSGGLFWHTSHYHTAATASHRSYSRAQVEPGQSHGGGPSNEHNYTTGLLFLYHLTGDEDAAEAVRGLATWVRRMDRSQWWLGGRLAPTGLASSTREPSFHGPGRGAGNSINALLDAWLLDGDRRDLQQAESLLRRCIHPDDDAEELQLLDIENRWSYTVFLGTVARYLELKLAAGEIDETYGYARACLVNYAAWMADHEIPYLDRGDELEFPTETWAAQELRKSNALFAAAAFEDGDSAQRLRAAGEQLSERTWTDLLTFPSRDCTRPIAILMTEGVKDSRYREELGDAAPLPFREFVRTPRKRFMPVRERLLSPLRRLRSRFGGG